VARCSGSRASSVDTLTISNAHRELVYRPLQFHERSQHFIGTNDETLSVAVSLNDPDRSPLNIKN